MDAFEVVTALDREICGGDLRKAGEYLDDAFQFIGVAPEPLDKAAALGVWETLRAGMPEFNHNMKDQRAPQRRGRPGHASGARWGRQLALPGVGLRVEMGMMVDAGTTIGSKSLDGTFVGRHDGTSGARVAYPSRGPIESPRARRGRT